MSNNITETDKYIERLIIIGMATSTDFMKHTVHLYRNPRLLLSASARTLSKWILEYYNKYEKAPNENLIAIFADKVNNNAVTEEAAVDIEDILNSLSEESQNRKEGLAYMVDQAKKYIGKRELEMFQEEVEGLLLSGDCTGARERIASFNAAAEELPTICNPFRSPQILDSAFAQRKDPLLRFPGAMGKFINPQCVPGAFVVFMAPEKKGKCLPGDQKVLLANGSTMPISELIKKDIRDIVSYDEKNKKFVKTRISHFWENGVKPVYKVSTKSGRAVEVTKNHPFLTPTGWKDLFEIGVGDYIAVPRKTDSSIYTSHLSDPALLWDEIVSVDYVGDKETFDLTVEEHHNFIAENVLVHNTFLLMEMVLQAVKNHKNVIFFQAGDMTQEQQLLRFAVYLSRRNYDPEYCTELMIPVMDCVYNQNDTCDLPEREADHGPFPGNSDPVKPMVELRKAFEDYPTYKPCVRYNCTKCKEAVWLQKKPAVPPLSKEHAQKYFDQMEKRYPNRLRMSSHANETLTPKIMNQELSILEKTEGWKADVIVIDYMDILASDTDTYKGADPRARVNQTWQRVRRMANERHALVISATQAAASAYGKKTLKQEDFSEDKRKFAHVTAMYGLNQDNQEKEVGIMRLNELVKRDGKYTNDRQVYLLQRLEEGRPFLGSFF